MKNQPPALMMPPSTALATLDRLSVAAMPQTMNATTSAAETPNTTLSVGFRWSAAPPPADTGEVSVGVPSPGPWLGAGPPVVGSLTLMGRVPGGAGSPSPESVRSMCVRHDRSPDGRSQPCRSLPFRVALSVAQRAYQREPPHPPAPTGRTHNLDRYPKVT